MDRMIRLESGRWYARVETDANGREYLQLSRAGQSGETMRARLPFTWRDAGDGDFADFARKPDLRIWIDEHGIQWKIAAVGPGTPYPFPFSGRHLVFDSQRAWSGLARAPAERELGDLSDQELRDLRDAIADFGGTRTGFRPPSGMSAE